MMKKLVSLLMAVTLMASILAGCGSSSSSSSGSSSSDSSASAEATDTNTVAVGAVVLARDDVPEDDIYTFVSTIFENIDTITQQHAKGGELDLEFASSVTSVPYHPGAAKYFEEKGYSVAAVKDGAGTGSSKALTFGTGGDTGTYYAFGGVLASYVSNNTSLSVTAVTSGGSKANIEDLDAGNVQLAFAQSDVLSYAYNGERLFDTAIEGFSVVAALYMEQVQIVTTNSDIQSVSDLSGKKVSIGAVGSGVYFNAIDVLESYGMTEDDISPVYQSFGDSADSLKDGKIDAAFVVAGAPTTAIVDLATSGNVYLVSLDQDHIDSLLESSPYYSAYTIPAGTY
jgi:TRAP transporter TAXI family solute receptor